jgi:hypothetical protein
VFPITQFDDSIVFTGFVDRKNDFNALLDRDSLETRLDLRVMPFFNLDKESCSSKSADVLVDRCASGCPNHRKFEFFVSKNGRIRILYQVHLYDMKCTLIFVQLKRSL